MNKISLVIISTFIVTLIVLITQPQMPHNIKFADADFGYNSTLSIQDSNTNIKD